MKPFVLAKTLAGEPVVTRDGEADENKRQLADAAKEGK